jgi:branched-chain amino acid aminotransferase
MKETEVIWHNGKTIPWKNATIHVLSHTLHYGGGAFEGIRCYETSNGTAVFRLGEHIDRLIYSSKTLNIKLSYTKEEIMEAIKQVIKLNNLKEGYVRPIVFYGYGKMGVNPKGSPVEFYIACWPWGAYLPHDRVDIKTSRYIRIHPDSTIPDAKLCGHYLNGILASLELEGTEYHEALFLDSAGFITEGVGENFFIVKSNVIYTPKLGGILAGITRQTIMMLAQQLGYKVIEDNITLETAYQADEAFFTGTAAEVTPIRSIDQKVLGHYGEQIGPVTQQFKKSYADIVRGKNPDFAQHLTYV